ncbi:MAG: hypothetical protein EOO85_29015, partial [Pedobacter sp.]
MNQSEIFKKLESVCKNGGDLISDLLTIEHELPYESKEFVTPTIQILSDKNIDIFKQALKSIHEGKNIFRVSELLKSLFAELPNIAISSLLDFLQE